MSVAVLGAGAFGTALAIALAENGPVTLWGRDVAQMQADRENTRRLPGCPLPPTIAVTNDLADATSANILLLAVPMQKLAGFLKANINTLAQKTLVACCKGIDLKTGLGPVRIIAKAVPDATGAVLTGPSFAADIARGLPTALTLACADDAAGTALQMKLSTGTLRLYRTTDTIGAELGGALKNVVAIASGAAIGAGFGESARAAVMTRGYAEMQRVAEHLGADARTLAGLSGFGDLTLTCTSTQSRNYRLGLALGAGEPFDPSTTVEGAATAQALHAKAAAAGLDVPITNAVAAVLENRLDVAQAMHALLARPLKEE